jgi:hypothetical protein
MRYLANWRMQLAKQLTARGDTEHPGNRDPRGLRLGSVLQPRVQARDWRAAGNLAQGNVQRAALLALNLAGSWLEWLSNVLTNKGLW